MKKTILLLMTLLLCLNVGAYKKESIDITVNGQSRNMVVFTPTVTQNSMPLMIVTHGMNQSPEYQYDGDKLYEMIDTAKFVVAYLRADGTMWDTSGTKDIDFVSQSIDELSDKYTINTNRVYWSGFSMGSMLIYHTIASITTQTKAADLVKRIACFAPTSGMQFTENPAASLKTKGMKINLIDHHSRGDTVFPIAQYDIRTYVTNIANSNEFTTYFSKDNYTSQEGNYKGLKEVWTNTNTGNVVELFMYDEGGHWPSYYNRKEIWGFCKRFSLQSIEEEYAEVYKKAQNLISEWKDTPEMTQKAVYTSLNTALTSYGPDKVTTQASMNKAISKLNTYIALFEKASASVTKISNGGTTDQPTEFDPNFHIYLCFGQSNMEGNAAIEAQDREYVDPRFRMMAAVDMSSQNRTKGNWYVAYPPLCRSYNGLTPADYFGREMVANLPDSIKVGVINVAVGGASIKLFDEDLCQSQIDGAAEWFKNYCKEYDNDPYKRLVECAKVAQKVGVIKGILLHQGCTDNCQKDWPVRVKRVYIRLLNDLGLKEETTPLLVGELVQQNMGGVCWGHNAVIAHITDAIPNAYVISSKDCPCAADGLHFTAEGYRTIGRRYAETMLTLLGQTKQIDFDASADPFPLNTTDFNASLYLQGTFKKTGTICSVTTSDANSFGGWRYSKGINMSANNYLVVKLLRACSAQPVVKVFDTDDYLNPCYSYEMKSIKIAKIDLHNMTTSDGATIDPSHIYMVGISTNATQTLYLSSVFLSDDGTNPTGIESVAIGQSSSNVSGLSGNIYDLQGRKIQNPSKGFYIVNKQKVFISK